MFRQPAAVPGWPVCPYRHTISFVCGSMTSMRSLKSSFRMMLPLGRGAANDGWFHSPVPEATSCRKTTWAVRGLKMITRPGTGGRPARPWDATKMWLGMVVFLVQLGGSRLVATPAPVVCLRGADAPCTHPAGWCEASKEDESVYGYGRSSKRLRWRRTWRPLAVVVVIAGAASLVVLHRGSHQALASQSRASAGASHAVPAAATTTSAAGPAAGSLAARDGIAPPAISAASYELMDVHTGQVLASANPDAQIPPASLAKLMTFDLTLRALAEGRIHLTDTVPLGPGVRTLSTTPGLSNMSLDLPPGATVSLQNLLLGTMVASGNDAALAVAEYVGGSEAAFVSMMNAEAAKLGMTRTHFVNPNGIQAPGQVTTAADMATLARHVWLTYPTMYSRFTDAEYFTWDGITFRNYNDLIGVDPTVTGMKSGYWGGVGWHLVTSAQQGNTELVGVVMGTASEIASAQLSQTLLNWGFAHFLDTQVSWTKTLPQNGLRVWGGKGPRLALRTSAQPWVVVPSTGTTAPPPTLVVRPKLPPYLRAPVRAGEVVGSEQAVDAGRVVATAAVTAAEGDQQGSLPAVLWASFRLWLQHL